MTCLRTAVVGFALSLAAVVSAQACACCSNDAQRRVEVRKFDAMALEELTKLRFRKEAKLALGEVYESAIAGLNDPSGDFSVEVAWLKGSLTFSLRDDQGRSGKLMLVQPKVISIFEVDPRDAPTSQGPNLYKEWKLTSSVTGDGIFRGSVGPNRRITLVVHGRGNGCTSADDFKHWTLLVHGPKTETYTFFGELAPIQ